MLHCVVLSCGVLFYGVSHDVCRGVSWCGMMWYVVICGDAVRCAVVWYIGVGCDIVCCVVLRCGVM